MRGCLVRRRRPPVSRVRLFALLVALLYATHAATVAESCPNVCNCKWKSGKKSVECSGKNLIAIPEAIDPETQLLDMSDNNLQTLPKETFVRAALLDLQKVYLRNCSIGQIDDRALRGLSNVVDLDLSRNLLTSIPSSIFEDVPNLRNLSLAHNPIQKIDASAFRYVSALIKLDLSHCLITVVAQRAFDGVDYLETLRLNGNRLAELRRDTLAALNGLHGIELHDNPWRCDCGLRALKLWLTAKNVPYPIEPTCAGGPARTLHRAFNQLHADDFACKPEMKMKPDHRYVESAVGDNATVLCRVESVPRPNISWYWNGRLLLNNSAFSPYQRVLIYESGDTERRSALTLTNAQESDSSQFYCVAENKAGAAEANFTLRVVHRLAGFALLGNAQVTALGVALVAVIFLVLVSIGYLLFCIRKMPPDARDLKQQHAAANGGGDDLANGGVHAHRTGHTAILAQSASLEARKAYAAGGGGGSAGAYAAQTLPRLNGIAYTSVYDGQRPSRDDVDDDDFGRRTPSSYHRRRETSNPDLIADASQKAGEYTRANHHPQHDLFYPSSLWSQHDMPSLYRGDGGGTVAHASSGGSASDAVVGSDYRDINDKTPIIEEVSFYESSQPHHHHHRPQPLPPRRSTKDCEYGAVAATSTAASAAASSSPAESPSAAAAATTPTSSSSSGATALPFGGGHPSAKTIRVWQKGVQVLPPVTALKRVLNRNSPDEGYQEGCGTDV